MLLQHQSRGSCYCYVTFCRSYNSVHSSTGGHLAADSRVHLRFGAGEDTATATEQPAQTLHSGETSSSFGVTTTTPPIKFRYAVVPSSTWLSRHTTVLRIITLFFNNSNLASVDEMFYYSQLLKFSLLSCVHSLVHRLFIKHNGRTHPS